MEVKEIVESLSKLKLNFVTKAMIAENVEVLDESKLNEYLESFEEYKNSVMESEKFAELVEGKDVDSLTEKEIEDLIEACSKEIEDDEDNEDELDENLPNPPKGKDLKDINDLVTKIKSKYNYKNFEVNYKDGQIYGGTSGIGFNNKGYDYKEVIEKLERILKYGEELFESDLDESVKLSDVEDLLGKGIAHGKYTKFTLKDGTYVLFHPTIGLEYRAKDDSLLPHNWKTVKAMKKELIMAGMLKEQLEENFIGKAMLELSKGNTGTAIEMFKNAMLNTLSKNEIYKEIDSKMSLYMNEASIRDKVKVNGISYSDKYTALDILAKKTGFWKDIEDFEKDYHRFINDEKLQGVSRTTLAKFLNNVKMENNDDYHRNEKAFTTFEVEYKRLNKLK